MAGQQEIGALSRIHAVRLGEHTRPRVFRPAPSPGGAWAASSHRIVSRGRPCWFPRGRGKPHARARALPISTAWIRLSGRVRCNGALTSGRRASGRPVLPGSAAGDRVPKLAPCLPAEMPSSASLPGARDGGVAWTDGKALRRRADAQDCRAAVGLDHVFGARYLEYPDGVRTGLVRGDVRQGQRPVRGAVNVRAIEEPLVCEGRGSSTPTLKNAVPPGATFCEPGGLRMIAGSRTAVTSMAVLLSRSGSNWLQATLTVSVMLPALEATKRMVTVASAPGFNEPMSAVTCHWNYPRCLEWLRPRRSPHSQANYQPSRCR